METRPREGTAVGCEGTARRTQECWRRKPGQSSRPRALPRDAERAGSPWQHLFSRPIPASTSTRVGSPRAGSPTPAIASAAPLCPKRATHSPRPPPDGLSHSNRYPALFYQGSSHVSITTSSPFRPTGSCLGTSETYFGRRSKCRGGDETLRGGVIEEEMRSFSTCAQTVK